MSSKKTIKVNPDFFSLKPSRKKTEKKREKREKLKKMSQIIRPNKTKKELLKRIKEHQRKKKEQQITDDSDNVIEFTENMKESLEYLQKIIKENKRKKQLKKTQKNYNNRSKPVNGENISLEIKPLEVHLDDMNVKKDQIKPSLVFNEQKGGMPKEFTSGTKTNIPQTQSQSQSQIVSVTGSEEPKYGCLKNGNKPTYRQYMKTLKKRDNNSPIKPTFIQHSINNTSSNTSSNTDNSIERNNIIERKNKLKALIEKSSTSNHKLNKNDKMGSYIRYKVRTRHKTYKIGKYKNKKNVGVLLKNNATRKKINQEIGILEKAPMSKVKSFLREKNLLKIGSKVPDNIARQMFINAILSGDVINKNYNVFVHNFLSN